MDIAKIDFSWGGKDYEIRIYLENGGLANGDFLAEAYLNGKKAFSAVRSNAMKSLAESIRALTRRNGKHCHRKSLWSLGNNRG
jgi:hypothetical protein